MNILSDLFHKSVVENEKNLRFWEDYLKNLQSLDFNVYTDKLKVPTLVPVGNRILFRGELKHTNEVTVSLGADYFVKCSINQAEILRQHRIKDARSKVEMYKKEKKYLENQVSLSKHVYENQGQEIVEVYSEEEDKEWRVKHRENMRQYKQKKGKTEQTPKEKVTDEELWNRLEELELQEELENELLDLNENRGSIDNSLQSHVSHMVKEDSISNNNEKYVNERKEKETFEGGNRTPKLDLLQQVIDKQNELENKLSELKNRDRSQSKTENDLISRLDEMEQLDELEDEMDRLDDILETNVGDDAGEDVPVKSKETKLQRIVSFADQDDSETIEISFKHSEVESNKVPYNPEKGILRPSDVYEAYSNLFGNETASILKKSKYESNVTGIEKRETDNKLKAVQIIEDESEKINVNRTIVVKDVVEKVDTNDNEFAEKARPTSLFKKRRMQNKT